MRRAQEEKPDEEDEEGNTLKRKIKELKNLQEKMGEENKRKEEGEGTYVNKLL